MTAIVAHRVDRPTVGIRSHRPIVDNMIADFGKTIAVQRVRQERGSAPACDLTLRQRNWARHGRRTLEEFRTVLARPEQRPQDAVRGCRVRQTNRRPNRLAGAHTGLAKSRRRCRHAASQRDCEIAPRKSRPKQLGQLAAKRPRTLICDQRHCPTKPGDGRDRRRRRWNPNCGH